MHMDEPISPDHPHPKAPDSRAIAEQPQPGREQAWVELLRTPLPYLDLEVFGQLHPVGVEHAGGLTLLRIQPAPEVKRALAPWTRRFGTTVPAFTSLVAEAGELLGAPEDAARWLQERPLLCCAVPVLDDLLIAARAMAVPDASAAIERAARQLAYAAAALVVATSQRWPDAQIRWADAKNRPTLRLVAQAIDLALAAQDHERSIAWMRWMLARDPEDAHGCSQRSDELGRSAPGQEQP